MRYDFKCPWCGNEFEEEMSIEKYIGQGRVTDCPKCKQLAERVYKKLATFIMEKKE